MENWGIPPNEEQLSLLAGSSKKRVRKSGGEFIMRIPVDWISAASALPGRAVVIGLALWFKAGVSKARQVKVTHSLLEKFGLNRYAGRRALKALESAGLVTVERGPGRSPIATIQEIEG
jgi:hypothetical protein